MIDTPPLPDPVYVDAEMWAKIVMNLVSNALKFTFTGGVTVRLYATDHDVELSVIDTGIGIDPGDQERLFERFHRVIGAQSRSHEGTGVGLALVAELAELHGGSAAVQSTPGAGSTFTVTIPFGAEHLPADQVVSDPSAPTAQRYAEGFVAEAMRWLDPGERGGRARAPARGRAPARARRRRQRRHAVLHRLAARRPLRGADRARRRRRAGARAA